MQPFETISDHQNIVFGYTKYDSFWHSQNADNQYIYNYKATPNFTGKELDQETGYSYFGARYLDHTLTTAWLSIDPMADKYPSISPYAYCAWNPLKCIDQDGMDSVHTPNGMANAGIGYRTTLDGMYLYGEGLQTKKWNPNLNMGGIVGECGGYEDYTGDPIDFNTYDLTCRIPIVQDVSVIQSFSVPIPVAVGGLLSSISSTVGDAVTAASSYLWVFSACLLFSSDSSPTQKMSQHGKENLKLSPEEIKRCNDVLNNPKSTKKERKAAKQKLKTHEKAEGTRQSRQSKDKKTKR